MRIGVEASNIRGGGGATHLVNLLAEARPEEVGIDRVILWACREILERVPNRSFLEKASAPALEGGGARRLVWQNAELPRLARDRKIDLLFAPGGALRVGFKPYATMSQNMLPFEPREALRYGPSKTLARLALLRLGQARTFRRANGMIFLTQYAADAVTKAVGGLSGDRAIIPHGVDERFRLPPRPQRPIEACSMADPFRLLYVSIVDVYKHQWNVAEAVARLRYEGWNVSLDLIGPAYPPAMRALQRVLNRLDPEGAFIRHAGSVPYGELPERYHGAEAFVFASSCENMPNIVLEAMAAGLPIACAERGPMPEMLGDAGLYFDPEDPASIVEALRRLLRDPALRLRLAEDAFERARQYSWRRCAQETFAFLAQVARKAGSTDKRAAAAGGAS